MPKTIRLDEKAEIDFEYLCATVGLPFVIKPTNKSNSLSVRVIRSKENLRKEILWYRQYDFSPLIAQSFIPGARCFVQNEELIKFTEVIVREVCYTGVIHIDARLHDTSDKIFLIEANPRFWGSLAEATSGGLNFVRTGIYASMWLESPDPR